MITSASNALIPVTLLAGYLGAGKTTLVNHVLQHADGLRIAILVNDFGDLPIDASLIEATEDDIVQLSGGCVCCSYGNDLTRALVRLQELPNKPEHVLIECSGVALPRPVMNAVGLLAGLAYDGTIVLVDASSIQAQLQNRYVADTVRRQLQQGDLMVINKTDMISTEQRSALEGVISSVTGAAPCVWVSQAQLSVDVVLSRHTPAIITGDGAHTVNTAASEDAPHAAFQSHELKQEKPIDKARLQQFLCNPTLGVVRAKGFVQHADGAWFLLQQVGSRCTFSPVDSAPVAGIVVIGIRSELDVAAINKAYYEL